MTFDYKGAHRTIKKKKVCWRHQVMEIARLLWVNLVGTFGVADISYWFFRAMAAMHRLTYEIGEPDWWGLAYADDSMWRVNLKEVWSEAARLLLFHVMCGATLSWQKTWVGLDVPWVGFHTDWKMWSLSLAKGRLKDLTLAARTILELKTGQVGVLESWAGKANHCTQVRPLIRPLLQPIWAFLSAVAGTTHRVTWPRQVQAAILIILENLHKRPGRSVSCNKKWSTAPASSDGSGGLRQHTVSTEAAKARLVIELEAGKKWLSLDTDPKEKAQLQLRRKDLKALSQEGSRKRVPVSAQQVKELGLPITIWVTNDVGVGGWWLPEGEDDPRKARWFAEKVPRERFPWLWATKGQELAPGGCSSTSAELFAAVILLDFRLEELRDTGACGLGLTMSSEGDNRGCGYILRKMTTNSEPGASIMRYTAAVCDEAGVWANMAWVPREENEKADVLSKGWPGGPREEERMKMFDAELRADVDWSKYDEITRDWHLLGSPFEVGGAGCP